MVRFSHQFADIGNEGDTGQVRRGRSLTPHRNDPGAERQAPFAQAPDRSNRSRICQPCCLVPLRAALMPIAARRESRCPAGVSRGQRSPPTRIRQIAVEEVPRAVVTGSPRRTSADKSRSPMNRVAPAQPEWPPGRGMFRCPCTSYDDRGGDQDRRLVGQFGGTPRGMPTTRTSGSSARTASLNGSASWLAIMTMGFQNRK